MTDTETDPDLSARLHAVARQVPAAPPDLDRVAAHADRRRRRRWTTTGAASALAVVVLAAGALALTRDGSDRERFTTVGASIGDGTSDTTIVPPATAPPTPAVPTYVVSEGDRIVWHLASGTVAATPAPGRIVRAAPVGDGTAVAETSGPDARVFRLAPGEVRGEVTEARGIRVNDEWSAGLVDDRPVLVGHGSNGVVSLDLDSGEQTSITTPDLTDGVWTADMTGDGRVLLTTGTPDEVGCATVLVDLRTMDVAPTAVPGCALLRRVSPDGTTVAQIDEQREVVVLDVATGEELARWPQGRDIVGEGAAADFDGQRYVLTSAVDGVVRPDPLVVDIETGAVSTPPGNGPTAFWVDPDA